MEGSIDRVFEGKFRLKNILLVPEGISFKNPVFRILHRQKYVMNVNYDTFVKASEGLPSKDIEHRFRSLKHAISFNSLNFDRGAS